MTSYQRVAPMKYKKYKKYRARLKGGGQVALILFLALPGCTFANSLAFLPISVVQELNQHVYVLEL